MRQAQPRARPGPAPSARRPRGYSRLMVLRICITIAAEASRVNHLWSAATTYHGAGAELSLTGAQTPLIRTMTELGVSAGVVLALSIALVLVRRLARLDRA